MSTIRIISHEQIDLSWNPPVNPNSPSVKYRIDISSEEDSAEEFTTLVEEHPTTNYSVKDLEPDTEYYFRIYSVSLFGTSSNFLYLSGITLEEPDPVKIYIPTNLTAIFSGADSVTLFMG